MFDHYVLLASLNHTIRDLVLPRYSYTYFYQFRFGGKDKDKKYESINEFMKLLSEDKINFCFSFCNESMIIFSELKMDVDILQIKLAYDIDILYHGKSNVSYILEKYLTGSELNTLMDLGFYR